MELNLLTSFHLVAFLTAQFKMDLQGYVCSYATLWQDGVEILTEQCPCATCTGVLVLALFSCWNKTNFYYRGTVIE